MVQLKLVANLGGLLAAAIFGAGVATAQDAHGALRDRLLTVADTSYQKLTRDFEIVDAATGESGHTTFQTSPGKMYFVYGLCDDSCTNIDIALSETSGEPILESDRRPDPRPVIAIPIFDISREVAIDLDMVACEAATCTMGIGIFSVELR